LKRVIIDTDPGIDDAAAILLALASPELSMEAFTTVYGNGTVDQCTRNILTLLEISNRIDIPVYKGVNVPLMRSVRYGHIVHGNDAFGDIGFKEPQIQQKPGYAAEVLVDLIMANPGEITLIALGPLTNVALALALNPDVAKNLSELIIMGGAVLVSGNASEVASANLYHDPEAASIVYQSGAPIVQVGLDVCQEVVFSNDEIGKLFSNHSRPIEFLKQISPPLALFESQSYNYSSENYIQYNDLPSVVYCISPELFDGSLFPTQISTHDEKTRGQTIVDLKNRQKTEDEVFKAKILLDVDAIGVKNLFINRLLNYYSEFSQ